MFKNLSIQNHIFDMRVFVMFVTAEIWHRIQKLVPVVIRSQLNFIFLHCF